MKNATDAPYFQWRLDPKLSGQIPCVGEIGPHAAHLGLGLHSQNVRADWHVCGPSKPLNDNVCGSCGTKVTFRVH